MGYGIEKFFLLFYCLAFCWPGLGAIDLRVVQQWSELQFVFPNETAQSTAIAQRFYVPGNSVPFDVDVDYSRGGNNPRIFVAIPRLTGGVPVTLGTVDSAGNVTGYPDYSWHDNQQQNCDGMTSVFKTAIDQCNRLWVLDTGKILTGNIFYCQPQLLAFNLTTDQLIYRHRLNNSAFIATSLFVTPVLDVRSSQAGDCSDTFVYLADVLGFGMVVVDVANDRSWRVNHRLFFPFPNRGSFTIAGESFDLMDGVLGMALSPFRSGEDRVLYFHALASTTENYVNTSVVRNATFLQNPTAAPNAITVYPGERPNQAAAEAMDRNGIMYFGLMDPPSIWCWNSATDYSPANFHQVAVNNETLQYAIGVKVIDNSQGEQELWVLTSSIQRYLTGSLTNTTVNFRIHTESITNILQGSPCVSS